MFAQERQSHVLAMARREGRVGVSDLAAVLDVTAETVRRDLSVLEKAGLLRRVHGGAMPVERVGVESGLAQRDLESTAEKDRIAAAALDQLPRGGSVVLDSGSTTARLAALLPDDLELTVVVNSPPVATLLAGRPQLTVVLVGGRVRPATLATVDGWAVAQLEQLTVDVAFLGTNGCSAARGLTTPDPAEAAVKAAMVAAARRSVVLADHTKMVTDHLVRFARLEQVDVVVTDTGLDAGTAAELAAAGPEVVRV